jgi:tetratricopeptide (TPR) repeat protein
VGEHREVAACLERALELDPTNAFNYNLLAYAYSDAGDHEKAISAVRKYLSLQPDVWNPYDSAWEIFTSAGRYEVAVGFLKEALGRNPDWGWLNYRWGYSELLMGKADRAREKFESVQTSNRARRRANIAYSYAFEGRYSQAILETRQSIAFAESDGRLGRAMDTKFQLAKLLRLTGEHQEALECIGQATRQSEEVFGRSPNPTNIVELYLNGLVHLSQGDFGRVETVLSAMWTSIQEQRLRPDFYDFYYLLSAAYEVERGDLRAAARTLDEVTPVRKSTHPTYFALRGTMALQSEARDQALIWFSYARDRITSRQAWEGGDGIFFFIERGKNDYYLAQAYEALGNRSEATRFYEGFLDLWKNADEGRPEVARARERLEQLRKTD